MTIVAVHPSVIVGPAYAFVFDRRRHQSVDKQSGQTAHVERWFNTLRQRLARFTRKTLAFSKRDDLHGRATAHVHPRLQFVMHQLKCPHYQISRPAPYTPVRADHLLCASSASRKPPL